MPAVRLRRLIPWILFLIFFTVMNETFFNVSTPRIAQQFALGPAGVSWVMTIFLVFFGIGSVIYGRLSDLFSLRSLIVAGVLIYDVGSILGFLLQSSYPLVLAARGIQGAGASAIPSLVFVVVARFFAPEQRGRLFGWITSTVSLSVGVGPVLGGFVSGTLGWPFLFLIPLCTLLSIPFLRRELPDEPRREGSVDFLGGVLVALTVGTLVVYLNFSDWYYLAAFLCALALLLLRILLARNPFIDPNLFRNSGFRTGTIVCFFLFATVFGLLFLIPLMLASLHGLDTRAIGLVLFPGAISSVVVGPIAGSLADRRGNPFVVTVGLGLLLVSTLAMSLLLGVSALVVSAAMLLTYAGFSFTQTALINSVSQTLPESETGTGMGVFNLAGVISGAVGTAVVGKALDGGRLSHEILPMVAASRGFSYANLMLAFSVVVVFSGILYLRGFRAPKNARQGLEAEDRRAADLAE